MSEARAVRFHRWHPSFMVGVILVMFTLMLVSGALESSSSTARILGLAPAVLSGVIAIRAFRSSTVLIDESHVTVRTLLRRCRWPLERISGASVKTGFVGAYRRSFPVLHFVDGGNHECREMNTSPARAAELAPIVEEINRAVQR
jgi:hypothetical protein